MSTLDTFFWTASSCPPITPATGTFRVNSITHDCEFFDGTKWVIMRSTPVDGFWDSYETDMMSDDELCALHPGLAELREELRVAKERYEAYRALCREKK